jgi:hypothetical protein
MQHPLNDRSGSGPSSKTSGAYDAASGASGSRVSSARGRAPVSRPELFGVTTVSALDRHERTVERIGAPSS